MEEKVPYAVRFDSGKHNKMKCCQCGASLMNHRTFFITALRADHYLCEECTKKLERKRAE